MSEKVNYNARKNNNKLKISVIVIVILIAVYIITISVINTFKSMPKEVTYDPDKTYYKVSDFNSLEEIFAHYKCKLISHEEINNVVVMKVSFDVNLYTGEHSNENHFVNLSRVIAEFLDFKNFEMIDTSKDIDIEVICEKPNIVQFKINGDINYYLNHDSDLNKRKLQSEITEFTIQSKELQQLIDSGWNEKEVDWGIKDSTCDDYNIYFDEGIKYRVVSRNVFNVIFTDKYIGQVAGGLGVGCTPQEVEDALGAPTFSKDMSLYGYLGKNNYLFFDFINNEISIYPVQSITKEDEDNLKKFVEDMNSSNNVKEFVTSLTDIWIDYDKYDFDSNYVDLRYTLKGVQLSIFSNSLKNGIFIYQNYTGNRDITDLENVYIKDTDFVFDEELSRQSEIYLNYIDEGYFTEEERKSFLGIEFAIRFRDHNHNDNINIGPRFYSRNREYPDSELDKFLEISSYKWYDDYKLIYAVNNDGLYVYNCRTRINLKLIDIDDKIIINDVSGGQIIYNDTEVITVEIN